MLLNCKIYPMSILSKEIIEDMEALQSKSYQKKIAQSRQSKKFYSREDIIIKFKIPIKPSKILSEYKKAYGKNR